MLSMRCRTRYTHTQNKQNAFCLGGRGELDLSVANGQTRSRFGGYYISVQVRRILVGIRGICEKDARWPLKNTHTHTVHTNHEDICQSSSIKRRSTRVLCVLHHPPDIPLLKILHGWGSSYVYMARKCRQRFGIRICVLPAAEWEGGRRGAAAHVKPSSNGSSLSLFLPSNYIWSDRVPARQAGSRRASLFNFFFSCFEMPFNLDALYVYLRYVLLCRPYRMTHFTFVLLIYWVVFGVPTRLPIQYVVECFLVFSFVELLFIIGFNKSISIPCAYNHHKRFLRFV